MIEFFMIGILVAIIGVLIYTNINTLKKLEAYENWIEYFGEEIERVYLRLKRTDEKNLFEKDDDVGFCFSEILRIVDEFNKRIK